MSSLPVLVNAAGGATIGHTEWNPRAYRCHLSIVREDDGSFSAIVMNLPGTGSCGKTVEEAIANAREAISGTIETYMEDKEEIPWIDITQYMIPSSAIQKWILVHV